MRSRKRRRRRETKDAVCKLVLKQLSSSRISGPMSGCNHGGTPSTCSGLDPVAVRQTPNVRAFILRRRPSPRMPTRASAPSSPRMSSGEKGQNGRRLQTTYGIRRGCLCPSALPPFNRNSDPVVARSRLVCGTCHTGDTLIDALPDSQSSNWSSYPSRLQESQQHAQRAAGPLNVAPTVTVSCRRVSRYVHCVLTYTWRHSSGSRHAAATHAAVCALLRAGSDTPATPPAHKTQELDKLWTRMKFCFVSPHCWSQSPTRDTI